MVEPGKRRADANRHRIGEDRVDHDSTFQRAMARGERGGLGRPTASPTAIAILSSCALPKRVEIRG